MSKNMMQGKKRGHGDAKKKPSKFKDQGAINLQTPSKRTKKGGY